MKKTNIALITLDYPPMLGGVARYLGNLVKQAEDQIDIFVPEKHGTTGPGKVTETQLLNSGWFAWRPAIGFIRRLKGRYEWVVVSHALPMGTAAWIARWMGGPPYAVLFHGLDLRLALTSKRKSWLLRRVLRGAGLVMANSQFTADEIRVFEPQVHPLVLTPGVEPLRFVDRLTARATLGIRDDECILLSVTRLVARKGLDTLITSLSSLPQNVRLIIIGEGTDRRRLEEMARPFGSRVTFFTHASDEERNVWYAAADLFALLAREEGRDVEGFGIVLLEAALAGLPVVTGRSGGVTEAVIDQQTGLVVDPENQGVVDRALHTLIHDQGLRQRLGQAGQERVRKEFRWEDRWPLLKKALKID